MWLRQKKKKKNGLIFQKYFLAYKDDKVDYSEKFEKSMTPFIYLQNEIPLPNFAL